MDSSFEFYELERLARYFFIFLVRRDLVIFRKFIFTSPVMENIKEFVLSRTAPSCTTAAGVKSHSNSRDSCLVSCRVAERIDKYNSALIMHTSDTPRLVSELFGRNSFLRKLSWNSSSAGREPDSPVLLLLHRRCQ